MFRRSLRTAASCTSRHFTTASGIFRKSCYSKVDYKVKQAVIRFAALDIGCQFYKFSLLCI